MTPYLLVLYLYHFFPVEIKIYAKIQNQYNRIGLREAYGRIRMKGRDYYISYAKYSLCANRDMNETMEKRKKSLKSNLNNFWYFILILLPLIKQMILFYGFLNSWNILSSLMSINIHNNTAVSSHIKKKTRMRNSSQGCYKFQLTNPFNGTYLIFLWLNYISLYSITPIANLFIILALLV